MSALSPEARRILEGLLAGKSLNELTSPGEPARAEVESYLTGALGEPSGPRQGNSRATKKAEATPVDTGGKYVAFSDGASRGNPGPAAVGYRIVDPDGTELVAEGHRIGRATNNFAEYRGAISVLEKAHQLGLEELELRLDSELVVKQINGEYRVKDANLAELKAELDRLLARFRSVSVKHVPRAQNAVSDRLANEALDSAG